MKKLLLVGAVIASGVAARAATDEVVTCRRSAIAVALTPGAPATYTVSGELCATPSERHAGTTVQLLIHGRPTTTNIGTSADSTGSSIPMPGT